MNNQINNIYNSLQEIAWYFGSNGINGECCDDLSLVEFMALKKFKANDFTIKEIGDALNFTKSGATRVVNRLENKGYVIRKNSPVDGRVCCVSITDKGTETLSRITENYVFHLKDVFKDIEPQVIEHIGDSLDILINAIQQHKPLNIKNE